MINNLHHYKFVFTALQEVRIDPERVPICLMDSEWTMTCLIFKDLLEAQKVDKHNKSMH